MLTTNLDFVPVYTVSLGRTREVAFGIPVDSTGNIEFGEYRGKPEDMFSDPIIKSTSGQLVQVSVADSVQPGSSPGAIVIFKSPEGWLLNFRQRKDLYKFWKPWKDIEDSGKSFPEKRIAKDALRQMYPDNLDINNVGVKLLLPEPIAPAQTVGDFTSALTKFDEGAELEVMIYSNDKGANSLIVRCAANKIELIDPRKDSKKKTIIVTRKFK